MEAVSLINAVLLGLLVFGAIAGIVKGLVRQVVELIGVVASFLLAMLFSGWLAALISEQTGIAYSGALVVSFVLLFIAGLVGFHYLGRVIHNLIHMTFLGWVDRFCGAILGLIVAMLIGSAAIAMVMEMPLSAEMRIAMESSEVSLFLRPMAPAVFDFVFEHGEAGFASDKILRRGGSI